MKRLITNLAAIAALGIIGAASINAQPHAGAHPPAVNINAATPAQLQLLPQVGAARAALIVAGRPYRTPGELARVKGIGRGKRLAGLLPFVVVSGQTTATAKIMTCKAGETGAVCQARVGGKGEVIQFANGVLVVEVAK